MFLLRLTVVLYCVKKICATGMIWVFVIIMYIELCMHNFFIAEQ